MPIPLSTWKDLACFRPSTAIQKKVRDRAAGWKVHPIEDAASYANLDYYSIRITSKPRKAGGERMTADEVFIAYKEHLLSPTRVSSKMVSFDFVDVNAQDANVPGTVMLLKIQPIDIRPYTRTGYCKDVTWLQEAALSIPYVKQMTYLAEQTVVDKACIVVAESSPQNLRVSTVRGGDGLGVAFTIFGFANFTPGQVPAAREHPVAGNREFGYTLPVDAPGDMIVYTIGADRLNGLTPLVNDFAATVGYCTAEIFWRHFINEFATWVNAHGGSVQSRDPVRHKLPWAEVLTEGVYVPAVADLVPWL